MKRILPILAAMAIAAPGWSGAQAGNATPYQGTRVIKTAFAYSALTQRLMKAIRKSAWGSWRVPAQRSGRNVSA